MNNEELTATVDALYGLCMAQRGQLAALVTINEAVILSLGTSLPPLIRQMDQNAKELSPDHRDPLEPESFKAFDSTLATFHANLRALGGG